MPTSPLKLLLGLIVLIAVSMPWDQSKARSSDEEADIQLIVHRDADDVEFYLSMPAHLIKALLGKDSDLIFSDQGRLPADTFRQRGSFELADVLFNRLQATSGTKKVKLRAMSMMAHPKDMSLPFNTPVDATLAISVCNNDTSGQILVPENVQLLYGGFGSGWGAANEIGVHFPKTGRGALSVDVRSFTDGQFVGASRVRLADGGKFTIPRPANSSFASGGLMGAFLLFAAAGLGLLLRRKKTVALATLRRAALRC